MENMMAVPRSKKYLHTEVGLKQMALAILTLGEDTHSLMEAASRYHESARHFCTSMVSMPQ